MRRLAGAALLLLAASYFLVELVVAAGWTGSPYLWQHYVISALGVPECTQLEGLETCSPRHVLMNAGLVGNGLRVGLMLLVMGPFLAKGFARGPAIWLGAVHAVGLVLVGFFPATFDASQPTRAQMHGVGAGFAIVGGALALVALTVHLSRRSRAAAVWVGLCAVVAVLGVVGLAIPGNLGLGVGLVERLAVNSVFVCQVGLGLALLLRPGMADGRSRDEREAIRHPRAKG